MEGGTTVSLQLIFTKMASCVILRHPVTVHCCVFQPANGCSARHSLVKIDFLTLKQLFLSKTEQNKVTPERWQTPFLNVLFSHKMYFLVYNNAKNNAKSCFSVKKLILTSKRSSLHQYFFLYSVLFSAQMNLLQLLNSTVLETNKQCVRNEGKKLRAAMAALTKNSGWFLISYDIIPRGGVQWECHWK